MYVVYKDAAGQWRWHYVAANNRIIAASSEGYWHKTDCLHSIEIMKASSNAPVVER